MWSEIACNKYWKKKIPCPSPHIAVADWFPPTLLPFVKDSVHLSGSNPDSVLASSLIKALTVILNNTKKSPLDQVNCQHAEKQHCEDPQPGWTWSLPAFANQFRCRLSWVLSLRQLWFHCLPWPQLLGLKHSRLQLGPRKHSGLHSPTFSAGLGCRRRLNTKLHLSNSTHLLHAQLTQAQSSIVAWLLFLTSDNRPLS